MTKTKEQTKIYCNNCGEHLTQEELMRYPIQWKFSGDMYCDKCLKELSRKDKNK